MNVRDLMSTEVQTCNPDDDLNRAAQIMWERDCGCVPVIDTDGRAIGMLTDRDVCMAAYTQGRPLSEIPVGLAMSRRIHTCGPDDAIVDAEALMRTKQIRRLPVVNRDRKLIGLLSLNDLARHAQTPSKTSGALSGDSIAATLSGICEPWDARVAAE